MFFGAKEPQRPKKLHEDISDVKNWLLLHTDKWTGLNEK